MLLYRFLFTCQRFGRYNKCLLTHILPQCNEARSIYSILYVYPVQESTSSIRSFQRICIRCMYNYNTPYLSLRRYMSGSITFRLIISSYYLYFIYKKWKRKGWEAPSKNKLRPILYILFRFLQYKKPTWAVIVLTLHSRFFHRYAFTVCDHSFHWPNVPIKSF